ncbi:helix-turn-helix domain-containing protein [Actinophytocola sediminis]
MPTPKPLPVLLADERQVLKGWARRRMTVQALALRSRIVLACAENDNNGQVAEQLGVSRNTVSRWRNRFVVDRLEGLSDQPRPGAPRKITDEQVEQVIVKTLEQAPSGQDTNWSTRSMAAATGMSHGHSASIDLGATVENRLKGVAVDEMRRSGRLAPNADIKGEAWKRPHVDGNGC